MKIYIRPISILWGSVAASALEAGAALPFLGMAQAFTLAEVILRSGGKVLRRDLVPATELESYCQKQPESLRGRASEVLHHLMSPRAALGLGEVRLELSRPVIQGVVNVTPDSFSDGGNYFSAQDAIAHGQQLYVAGADILDIGGESTRPGAVPVSPDEEQRRVLPVIEGLKDCGAMLSIDTRHSATMTAAVEAGAHLINDVSALSHDAHSLTAAAKSGLPVVLMHAQGTPQTMQQKPLYHNVLLDVYDYLESRVAVCQRAGIAAHKLIVDPGIGFGKTVEDNLALLQGVSLFHGLGVPILLGVSRKSFIGQISAEELASRRLPGSLAAAQDGWEQGVQIIRVHDVAETRQALAIWMACKGLAKD